MNRQVRSDDSYGEIWRHENIVKYFLEILDQLYNFDVELDCHSDLRIPLLWFQQFLVSDRL